MAGLRFCPKCEKAFYDVEHMPLALDVLCKNCEKLL
jgi:hypothetical protein